MKYISLLLFLIFSVDNIVRAQNAHFMQQGVIEFEKSVNVHALIKKQGSSFYGGQFNDYIKLTPQFSILKSTLRFSNNKTLFVPEEENGQNLIRDAIVPQLNTIFTDIATGTFINQKKVFEETFIIKDSTRKITWKITDEFREIAGYNCRRANAIILDSIYVVAFYAEEIAVSGGPESFSGLPGMILGIALPHDNVTWFATKIREVPVTPGELIPPSKGKAVTKRQLDEMLAPIIKDWWGNRGQMEKAYSL